MKFETENSMLLEAQMEATAIKWRNVISTAKAEGRELNRMEKLELQWAAEDAPLRRVQWGYALQSEGKPVPTIARYDWQQRRNAPGLRVSNDTGKYTLWLYGEVGRDFDAPGVRNALLNVPERETLDVRIHSPGGSYPESMAILETLDARKGTVNVFVDGWACSGGSIIMMAGDVITVAVGAEIMIHEVRGSLEGATADKIEESLKRMRNSNDSLTAVYMRRWIGTEDELREALRKESWYTPAEAVAVGLADRIGSEKSIPLNTREVAMYKNVPPVLTCKAQDQDCVERNLRALFLHRLH